MFSLSTLPCVLPGPVDASVRTKEYDSGWYVGQTSRRGDARKGDGTFYFLNGDRYTGKWARDKMDGSGVYQYKNGDRWIHVIHTVYLMSDARFEGVFNKGEFSGDGLFFFGSLDKYDGEFSQGKLQGRGKMTYRDGHIYVGQVYGRLCQQKSFQIRSSIFTYKCKDERGKLIDINK